MRVATILSESNIGWYGLPPAVPYNLDASLFFCVYI